jgi:hypothetical protein
MTREELAALKSNAPNGRCLTGIEADRIALATLETLMDIRDLLVRADNRATYRLPTPMQTMPSPTSQFMPFDPTRGYTK